MTETGTLVCTICRWPVDLDDVAVPGEHTVICLHCYLRETGTVLIMPSRLRRIVAAVAGIEGDTR